MSEQFKQFTEEHKPFKSIENLPVFLTKWVALALAASIVGYFILSLRVIVPEYTQSSFFYFENIMWFLLALFSAFGLYQSSFPHKKTQLLFIPVLLIILAQILMAMNHEVVIIDEMGSWQGRCSLLITGVAFLQSTGLFFWARKGAAHSPGISGLWIGLSSASVGSLLMQLACGHENTLHLFTWHFAPIFLICGVGAVVARKVLRW